MSHQTSARFRTLWVLALIAALALATVPAAADDAGEEAPAPDGPSGDVDEPSDELSITVRPKIVAPGRSVLIQVGYGIDWPGGGGSADDGVGEDDGEGADDGVAEEDGEPDEDADLETAAVAEDDGPDRRGGPPSGVPGRPVAVTFTIDFGDDSGEQAMRLTRQDPRGQFGAALAQHSYEEAGDYTVVVTATPADDRAEVTEELDITVGAGSARLEGEDREATSADVSLEGFPEDGSAEAVLIARSDEFADALASAPLAVEAGGPLLLTKTDELPSSVYDEIARALAEDGTVYILGGEAAVSADVQDQLEDMGYTVERVQGEDRVGTAIAVTEFLIANGVDVTEVVLANDGSDDHFADALAGGAYAASVGAPVLLTGAAALHEDVAALLERLGDVEVLAVGGEAVLSADVLAAVEDLGLHVERIAGDDRYATSLALAQARYDDPDTLVFATGSTFADAVSAAAFAGQHDAPVLLVDAELSDDMQAYLEGLSDVQAAYIVGGPAAVTDSLKGEIEEALGLEPTVK